MTTHFFLCLALFLILKISINVSAFTFSSPARLITETRTIGQSTRLWAEEAGDDDDVAAPSNDGGASDILNSPAFLSRKIDVLKSDIEAAEAEIEELTKTVDEGKAEWVLFFLLVFSPPFSWHRRSCSRRRRRRAPGAG